MNSSSLFFHVIGCLSGNNIRFPIYGILTLTFVNIYIQYRIIKNVSEIVKVTTSASLSNFLAEYLILNSFEEINRYAVSYIKIKYFIPVLQNIINDRFWNIFKNASTHFLKDNSKIIYSSISKANNAIVSICMQGIRILHPIAKILSQCYIIYVFIGLKGLIILFQVWFIFYFSFKIININYKNMKVIDQNITPKKEFNRAYSTDIAIEVINGNIDTAVRNIVNNENYINSISIDNSLQNRYYNFLQFFGSNFVTYFILKYFSNLNDLKVYIAVFYSVEKVVNYSYWLFGTTDSILKSASSWGSLEKLLGEFEEKSYIFVSNVFDLNVIIPGFMKGEEIEITGKSGCGKTTWMKNKLYFLKDTYDVVQWLYLPQDMHVNLNDLTILEIMSQCCDNNINIDCLIKYSEILGISNIINRNTLDQKFDNPSGGEQKRIMFLRAIIKILSNPESNNIKVIFCDEITAGLDSRNENSSLYKVRSVIEILKNQFKISIISIDHHDINTNKKYEVRKKITNTRDKFKSSPIVKTSSLCQFFNNYFLPMTVESYDFKTKNSKKNTEVITWLKDIEKEPC